MAEQSTIPVSTATGPSQDVSELAQSNAIGYGFMRPSFSYLNAMPSGSSQQSPSANSESPRSLPSPQPMASSPSMNPAPSFSYNVSHSSASFSIILTLPTNMANEQHHSTPGKSVSSPIKSVPPAPSPTSHSVPFVPGPALQLIAPPGHWPILAPEGNSSHAGNFSFNRSLPPKQIDQSFRTNLRPDGTRETGTLASATHLASNSFNNMWMHQASAYQVPTGMPRTPGLTSSNTTFQQQAVPLYPSPSPQPVPGPWLLPQPISGFARPQFSPYASVPGPYPMPSRGIPLLSVSVSDIQPPGVLPAAQTDLPLGVENGKHVSNDRIKDEASSGEHWDAWTAHRTETGIVYYYNAITRESTYEKPSGFNGESVKATVQPNPISWEKLLGTDWTLVTTSDDKKYYYNSTTQLSSWQIPNEVTELRKNQEADASKAQSLSVTNINIVPEKVSTPVSLSSPAANTGGRDATPLRPSVTSGSVSALDLIKKKLQDSGLPASTSTSSTPGPNLSGSTTLELNGSKPIETTIKDPQNESSKDKRKNVNGDMSGSSSDSEDEDRGPTKEECILQFKEMLKERGVAPFSKWDKELPKIVFDPRFKAIASHSARRALFEHYVRTRAEEERKEKRAAQKAALADFKQLLEEAKEEIDQNTDYHAFKKKWGENPRFQALDRKEREILLNERVFPLKRAAQEKAQAERAVAVSDFKSMLQDKEDISFTSRWSKVKDNLKIDPRYKSVKREDREKLFNEYVAELKAAGEEVERKEKAKQDDEEKLKIRERALRKRKEREEQEVERVRVKARRKESVESYQALLVETIKDPQASWTESKPKLEKDPQGRAANSNLDKSDVEKLFRDHVKSLQERCVTEFRALLNEVITPEASAQETKDGKTIVNSWSTAKHVLKSDPRYNKMPRKERESLWRRHAEEILRKLKSSRDHESDKHVEGKNRTYVDSGKYVSSSLGRINEKR